MTVTKKQTTKGRVSGPTTFAARERDVWEQGSTSTEHYFVTLLFIHSNVHSKQKFCIYILYNYLLDHILVGSMLSIIDPVNFNSLALLFC